jgi:hypothetical protein
MEVKGMSGKLYLLSTGYVPADLEKYRKIVLIQRLISIQEAKQLLANGFISAIGHQSTADIMSKVLGITVPYNRIQVFLQPGDEALCFILKARPPEGRVLSKEEIERIGYYFIHVKVLEHELVHELAAQGIC